MAGRTCCHAPARAACTGHAGSCGGGGGKAAGWHLSLTVNLDQVWSFTKGQTWDMILSLSLSLRTLNRGADEMNKIFLSPSLFLPLPPSLSPVPPEISITIPPSLLEGLLPPPPFPPSQSLLPPSIIVPPSYPLRLYNPCPSFSRGGPYFPPPTIQGGPPPPALPPVSTRHKIAS